MDKIARIRQEIERRIKLCNAAPICSVRAEVNKQLLSLLDTLAEEPDNDDLNEEIKKEMVKLPFFIRGKDQIAFARHFAQWGAEHLRDSTKMMDKSLEEEIETWIPAHISVGTDETLPVNPTELANTCKEWGKGIARHFAEWGAEHLKK